MSYVNSKNEEKYSDKEKYEYHKSCADKGINPVTGEKLTLTQKIRHANLAEKYRKRLNRFMKRVENVQRMQKIKVKKN